MDESLPGKNPSESTEASSSRVDERAICLPHRPKQSSDEFSVGRGHSYEGVHISDQSIVHMGDRITVNNLSSSPHGEDRKSERHQKLLEALHFERMDLRRATIEQAHAETCQWVFNTKQYLSWQDSTQRDSHHGFFWIKRKPGSGKSTMMKCILERQQSATPSRTVLSFFFNARGGPLERTIQGCYRSLLYQLLQQVPEIRNSIHVTEFPSKGQDWPLATVQDLLRRAVLGSRGKKLVLVIDALDECAEDEVRNMIQFIVSLARSANSLDICLASRHYPRITVRRCEELVIEEASAHDEDILEYVREMLNVELDSNEDQERLTQKILQKAQGVFLWIRLVVSMVNEQFDRGETFTQLLSSVEALPAVLDALIGSIISDGASDAHLLPTLLWVLVGNADLSLEELYFGIKVGAGTLSSPTRDSDSADRGTMIRFITFSSKGLLERILGLDDPEDGHPFQFIHESVRQHVLAGKLAGLSPSLACNVEAESHSKLAEWCILYTQLRPPNDTDIPVDSMSGKIAWGLLYDNAVDCDVIFEQTATRFPLLLYAYYNTFSHLNTAYLCSAYDLRRLRSFPRRDWIDIANLFLYEGYLYLPSTSLLHLMLESIQCRTQPGLITGLMEQHMASSTNNRHEKGATGSSDDGFFDSFLGQGVNEFCGGLNGTPLVAAASDGPYTCVEFLLDLGADVNKQGQGIGPLGDLDGYGATPLSAAACYPSKIKTVELLLDRGADVNAPCGLHGSALAAASYSANMGTIELLLRRGADASLEDSKGQNLVLREAISSQYGTEEQVEQLLCHVSLAMSKPYETALSETLRRQDCTEEEVALSHQHVIRVSSHARDKALQHALQLAVKACGGRHIEIFVNLGADPSGKDSHGRTGLHVISEGLTHKGFASDDPSSAASILLSLGADINALGGDYGTTLIAASAKGFTDLVRLFLKHAVNLSYSSDKYGSAIEAARMAGNEHIVEILSEASSNRK